MVNDGLTRERLPTAEAVFTLGLLVVKKLQDEGAVTLFINQDGEVEICPPWEISLDGVSEQDALETLLARGYSDEQLADYLKGREARTAPSPHVEDLRQKPM